MLKALVAALAFASVSATPFISSPLVPRATCSTAGSCSSGASSDSCCSPTYGLFVLVQQWEAGVGPNTAFTLHGLWPDACDGTFAPSSGCDSSRVYTDVDTRLANYGDQTLVQNVVTYWPTDGSGGNTANSFHSHEWSKHGTCVSTLAPACYSSYKQDEDVHDFFSTTIGLRAKYDIYKAFTAAGLTPGQSADVSKFEGAIQTTYGVTADVNCATGVINEIRLYLNTNGPLTFVPVNSAVGSTCSGTVQWPSKGSGGGPSTSTTATGTKTSTTKTGTKTSTTSSPSGTGLGSCSYNGDTYCLSSDGTSPSYKQCISGQYVKETCPSGQDCYQSAKYNSSCQ